MQLLTVKEVAHQLKISVRSVWKFTAAGQIPKPVRIGRSARWRQDELEQFIARDCQLTVPVRPQYRRV